MFLQVIKFDALCFLDTLFLPVCKMKCENVKSCEYDTNKNMSGSYFSLKPKEGNKTFFNFLFLGPLRRDITGEIFSQISISGAHTCVKVYVFIPSEGFYSGGCSYYSELCDKKTHQISSL